ncbi:transposase [Mesorhizobium sp. WSM2561]|uniref:transposase n=1 Tax=Mesorhizobium sp. WSM2561 TaxID=1040985 RepID=UPI0032AE9D0E
MDAHEFIRRFLLHTLPDGFHRIRHWLPRQRPSRRQARTVPQAAGQPATGRSQTGCRNCRCRRRTPCGSASLPMLRRADDHARHLAMRTGAAEPLLERHLLITPGTSSSLGSASVNMRAGTPTHDLP